MTVIMQSLLWGVHRHALYKALYGLGDAAVAGQLLLTKLPAWQALIRQLQLFDFIWKIQSADGGLSNLCSSV